MADITQRSKSKKGGGLGFARGSSQPRRYAQNDLIQRDYNESGRDSRSTHAGDDYHDVDNTEGPGPGNDWRGFVPTDSGIGDRARRDPKYRQEMKDFAYQNGLNGETANGDEPNTGDDYVDDEDLHNELLEEYRRGQSDARKKTGTSRWLGVR